MWSGLDLVPYAPSLADGRRLHPDVVRQLERLGQEYAEAGGAVVISARMHDEDAFPINAGDPLEEAADWAPALGARPATLRRWDGLPFLADTLQRTARQQGVPVRPVRRPLDHSVWTPLRWLFPPETAMPVLAVGTSGLGPRSHMRFGQAIRNAVQESPKPIAVFIASNLSHRPERLRWEGAELSSEARMVDAALLEALRTGNWSTWDNLRPQLRARWQPDGPTHLWSLVRGLIGDLRGEVRWYGPELGAYGMALVHFNPDQRHAA